METETPKVVKSKAASPDKESWYRFSLQEQQETPKRLEDAAKFLASMISVSLSIFLSVSGKDGLSNSGSSFGVILSLIFWIVSLLMSFFVLFPFRYKFSSDSVKSFQKTHQRIVKVKRILLIVSLIFFALALIILGILLLNK